MKEWVSNALICVLILILSSLKIYSSVRETLVWHWTIYYQIWSGERWMWEIIARGQLIISVSLNVYNKYTGENACQLPSNCASNPSSY